jgi:hypothetical protein
LYRAKIYILLILFILPFPRLYAQLSAYYKLDIYSDLPSNSVYNLTVDHNNYLWIATDRGVVKYNGYKLTFFDLNKGFINKDIWNVFEDRSGKMWLYNLSDNFSYIYNDDVHYIKTKYTLGAIYPQQMFDYDNGLGVITSFSSSSKLKFCFLKDDSLVYDVDIEKYGKFIYPTQKGKMVMLGRDNNFYELEVRGGKLNTEKIPPALPYTDTTAEVFYKINESGGNSMGYCLTAFTPNDHIIYVADGSTRKCKKIVLPSTDNIKLLYTAKGQITAVTNDRILFFDGHMNLTDSMSIPDGMGAHAAQKITFLLRDNFWKDVAATNNGGVYFLGKKETYDMVPDPQSEDLKYLGKSGDTLAFWYNTVTGELIKETRNMVVARKLADIPGLSRWTPYKPDHSLLFSDKRTYKLDNRTLDVTDLGATGGGKAAIPYNDSEILCISFTKGLAVAREDNGKFVSKAIDQFRYNGITYDSLKRMFLAYNARRVVMLRDGKTTGVIERKDLEARNINSIVKIMPDNAYGNIIIQEGERIITSSDAMKSYKVLFGNYIFTDAKALLYRKTLIIAGSFGTIFSRITGPGIFSEPLLYPNTRSLKYKVVYDIHVVDNKLFIATDKGFLQMQVPDTATLDYPPHSQFDDYKLVITSNGRPVTVKQEDTILVRRPRKLQFDVIKPTGNGQVTYLYKIEEEQPYWTELEGNSELILPKLTPGRSYVMTIIARDKQWQSPPVQVNLYIVPEWWENDIVRRLMWVGALAGLLIAIYIIVIITKRIVSRNAQQRNARLELELRSVYSQINPHFIFNSLTAAMYLIKTGRLQDAYDHVHKFSHLLRSYIKSSRNRLISLGDEVKNLTVYIELQQARFKDKFDYKISVAPDVSNNTSIPSLLLQPLVENAITHGLLHKSSKGTLSIDFRKKEDHVLECVIDDDGIGRERAKGIRFESSVKEESYGSELIKDLIHVFNKYEALKIEIDYIDKTAPAMGTTVLLRIKYLKNE